MKASLSGSGPLSQLLAMKSQRQAMIVIAMLAVLAVIPRTPGAEKPFAEAKIDSAFSAGLAKVKKSTGFVEDPPGQSSIDWKPNLQLLVGVNAIAGSKPTTNL